MSCLSVRFPPARKAWKNFTSKLQSKLHKLQGSKTMKKQRYQIKPTSKREITASVFMQKHQDRKKRDRKRLKRSLLVQCLVRKKPAPVYIDKLFKESVSVLEFGAVRKETKYGARSRETTVKSAASMNNFRHLYQQPALPEASTSRDEASGTSDQVGIESERAAGDDMWEQVGLASPLMYGIDARAEEFIARFRAEMKSQEMLARQL